MLETALTDWIFVALHRAVVSNDSMHWDHLEGLSNMIDRVSESVGLERSWRICISDEFPSDADAAGLETMLQLFITLNIQANM